MKKLILLLTVLLSFNSLAADFTLNQNGVALSLADNEGNSHILAMSFGGVWFADFSASCNGSFEDGEITTKVNGVYVRFIATCRGGFINYSASTDEGNEVLFEGVKSGKLTFKGDSFVFENAKKTVKELIKINDESI